MKPNIWTSSPNAAQTRLTYAVLVQPSPLTISLNGQNPTLASLEVTVTNATGATVEVESVTFTIIVGQNADCLTTGSQFNLASSDSAWIVTQVSNVSSGEDQIVLGPASGVGSVPLAAAASVVMQISSIPTSLVPGTSTVTVKEKLTTGTSYTSFQVTTFPYGFFFHSLTVAVPVPGGGGFMPTSQVPYNTPVTLLWSSSVVDPEYFAIFYSSNQGQQEVFPTKAGEWVSPPLVCDTVFTVEVKTTLFNREVVTTSLAAAVSVTPQDLSASSLTVSGATTLEGPLNVSGPAQMTAGLNVAGRVGMLGAPQELSSPSTGTFPTDGLVVGSVNGDMSNPATFGGIAGSCAGITVYAGAGSVLCQGFQAQLFGSSFVLPVQAGAPVELWYAGSGPLPYTFSFVPFGTGGSAAASSPPPPPAAVARPRLRPEIRSILEALLIDDADERKRRVQALLEADSGGSGTR